MNENIAKYMKYIYPILIFLLVNFIFPFFLNIMGVDLSSVINYFLLINLLLIFYYILPDKVGLAFNLDK
jgi:hypothetical protein